VTSTPDRVGLAGVMSASSERETSGHASGSGRRRMLFRPCARPALICRGILRDTARAMSQEKVEKLVTEHYAAFNARNLDALLATCTTDVEIDDRLRVDAGIYRGKERVRSYFEGLWDVASSAEVAPVQFRYRQERVWVRARVWARGQTSGAAAEMTFAHVFTIRGGRISRIEVYADSTQALEAAGLSEQDAHADS
jgi:uncharacterized protein